ncbi:hypothetical protein IOZ78_002916 [Salmonella enterica]|uniref:Uncharacterized protein n=1 Tax=Citrobacter freundii TaxID=546 RepID=A0A9P3Z4T2_CITFR|nr:MULTISPECIES: hypothetical protein [Enterobacteriaceae]EGK6378048.1 hypothetical protein [Salmonella enterica]HBH7041873.1 hypothetical protein [Citrobacter freundii]EFA7616265.1 hypothetical protein [Escherichia coli]MBB2289498.1 hypothetical protein [Escherichia coli]MBJ8973629.1 hypothetical protein [Citrobacter braakii]
MLPKFYKPADERVFLWQISQARRIKALAVAEWNSSLAGITNQSYLYVTQLILGKRHAKSGRYDRNGKGSFQ